MLPFKCRRLIVLDKRENRLRVLRFVEQMKTRIFWENFFIFKFLPVIFFILVVGSLSSLITINWAVDQIQTRFDCTHKK